MDMNSQESEIINEGVLKYIMDDLGTSQPYMFLQDNDAYVDIYNPAHQQQLNNENLLQQHQIKSEHQLQQHLNEDCQLQQHLTDGSHLQQQQQHLNNDRHLHEQQQQHLNNDRHLQEQHLNNNPHLQQQQFDNHQLQQQQQQQHVNEDHQLPQQLPLTDDLQLHHQQQQQNMNDNRQLMDGGGEAMGGGEVGAPPPPQHTSPTGLQPCLTIYPGCYDFHVTVANTHNGRHAWVYSSKLQKIYIDIDKVLMLQFRLNTVDVKGLCVRALLVYSGPDHVMQAVDRCTLHLFKCDPNRLAHADTRTCNCSSFKQCGHVITADHPLARYEWNASSGRHSVLVPLSQAWAAGQDAAATVAYQFGCKTSCTPGMSRRPVLMVFTLEDQFGDVLGRSTLAVKICSCPKRDKDREENGEAHWTSNQPTNRQPPPLQQETKKRKLQHSKVALPNEPAAKVVVASPNNEAAKDANHSPGIATLLEEVQKLHAKFDQLNNLHAKFDQLNNKVDKILRELAPNLRDDNSRPNKIEITGNPRNLNISY